MLTNFRITVTVGPNVACTADFLVVLIIHVVTSFVTHLTGKSGDGLAAAPLGVNRLIANTPSVCIVNSLDCTVFCVRCVGVRPLLSRLLFGVEEALHTAVAADTVALVVQVYAGMRNGFPAGLLLTTLEGVDQSEAAAYVLLCTLAAVCCAESIPVINVSQPVHQVQTLIAAVCIAEIVVDRVLSLVAVLHSSRIILNLRPLIAVSSTQRAALAHEAVLLIRNHGRFHGLPCLCQIADSISLTINSLGLALVDNVITHCSNPYQVGQSLRCGFMTVVRSLDTQFLYRVIRYTETAVSHGALGQIAVLLTIGNNVIVQRHEALCIGAVTIGLFLGAGASCRSGSRQNSRTSHCSSQNRSQNGFTFLELHFLKFPSQK